MSLASLQASLYSVWKQDLSNVTAMVIVDNNTDDSEIEIEKMVKSFNFPMPVIVKSFKHGDSTKTHSWSTNRAVSQVSTEWVLFTRADYLLDFDLVRSFSQVVINYPVGWNGFVTGNVYHLSVDLGRCDQTTWRNDGPKVLRELPGSEADYTCIDAGVWLARKSSFDRVGGLEENLTMWGHAQTHFQHKLFQEGVEFHRIPRPMYFHPKHSAERDLGAAHKQLADLGVNLNDMWARSHVHPYGR